MNINPIATTQRVDDGKLAQAVRGAEQLQKQVEASEPDQAEQYRETFQQFVGETFFGLMIKSMRATTDKPAYFHGGRAEEVFTSQLDQQMSQQLAKESAGQFADPMFELMNLPRR